LALADENRGIAARCFLEAIPDARCSEKFMRAVCLFASLGFVVATAMSDMLRRSLHTTRSSRTVTDQNWTTAILNHDQLKIVALPANIGQHDAVHGLTLGHRVPRSVLTLASTAQGEEFTTGSATSCGPPRSRSSPR
jgi:hypothetical protein